MVVVVIGGPDALLHAARRAAPSVTGARVLAATVEEAATVVAESRPFAILISDELYQLDPPEFDALARDVSAVVVPLETLGLAPVKISEAMTAPLVAALKTRTGG